MNLIPFPRVSMTSKHFVQIDECWCTLHYLAALFDAQLCTLLWSKCEAFREKLCIRVDESVRLILELHPSCIDLHITVYSTARTYSWRVTLALGKPLPAAKINRLNSFSQSLPHSGYDFPWWYLISRSKCLGELYQRTWWHSSFLPRLKYVPLWPCFSLFAVCSIWSLRWLVVLLGRSTWPPDEKFATLRGVRRQFVWWAKQLTCFISWRWIPDNVSVSLVRVPPVGQTQVYRHAILNSQKSTFVSFILFLVRYCACQLYCHSGTV